MGSGPSLGDTVAGDRRSERQAALRRRLEGLGLDGLLVTHGPNIRYLTGFTGSAGLLLVTNSQTLLITDFRYAEQAPEETQGAADVATDSSNLWERLKRACEGGPRIRLGFERDSLTVRDAERLGAGRRGPVEPVPASDVSEK